MQLLSTHLYFGTSFVGNVLTCK